jgi:hypothetical protein
MLYALCSALYTLSHQSLSVTMSVNLYLCLASTYRYALPLHCYDLSHIESLSNPLSALNTWNQVQEPLEISNSFRRMIRSLKVRMRVEKKGELLIYQSAFNILITSLSS